MSSPSESKGSQPAPVAPEEPSGEGKGGGGSDPVACDAWPLGEDQCHDPAVQALHYEEDGPQIAYRCEQHANSPWELSHALRVEDLTE